MHSRRAYATGAACAFLAALGFSSKAVMAKMAYAMDARVDVTTIMAGRMLFALPVFAIAALWAGRSGGPHARPLTAREIGQVAALGIFSYYGSSWLDIWGLAYITASLERIILFVYPTLVVAIGALFLNERLGRPVLFSLVLTYAGVAVAVLGRTAAGGSDVPRGVALVFAAAAVYAVYLVAAAPLTRRMGTLRFTAYAALFACGAALAHYTALHHPWELFALPARLLWLLALMAVIATALPIFLMTAGIRRIGSGPAAIVSTVGPVATLLMDRIFLGTPLTPSLIAGTVLVLAGVTLITRKTA